MPKRSQSKGFTLIELMITVSIIAILASIVIPKFADMVRKAKEAAIKGQLGALRSAITIYYSDMSGYFPNANNSSPMAVPEFGGTGALMVLTNSGKYMSTIPQPGIPGYHEVILVPDMDVGGSDAGSLASYFAAPWNFDVNGPGTTYLYFGDPLQTSTWGIVVIDCSHTDARGTEWTRY
jgi:prepilin-type N-terminal cleavage/methylation domain-containing protein